MSGCQIRTRSADSLLKAGIRGSGVVVVKLKISKHCVERWRERFRPALDDDGARRELERVVANGVLTDAPPPWSGLSTPDSHTSFLVVGEDLVLVLVERGHGLLAATCIPRGSIPPGERKRRKHRRYSPSPGGGRRKARRPEPYRRSRMSHLRSVDPQSVS